MPERSNPFMGSQSCAPWNEFRCPLWRKHSKFNFTSGGLIFERRAILWVKFRHFTFPGVPKMEDVKKMENGIFQCHRKFLQSCTSHRWNILRRLWNRENGINEFRWGGGEIAKNLVPPPSLLSALEMLGLIDKFLYIIVLTSQLTRKPNKK